MPFVRIDIPSTFTAQRIDAISDVVYEAMHITMNVPADDRFQMIASPRRVFDREYLSISRSDDTVFIEITLRSGRTPDVKRAFYAALASGLEERAQIAKSDVFIVLHENEKIDWSFGNGIAQYEPDS